MIARILDWLLGDPETVVAVAVMLATLLVAWFNSNGSRGPRKPA